LDRYGYFSLADSIKRTLEEETGDSYALENGQPRHRNAELWHISLDEAVERGYIEFACLADGRLFFTSCMVFHADFHMQNRYSEVAYDRMLYRLGPDFEWLHIPELRRKHSRDIPRVFRFLNQLDGQISKVNQRHSTDLRMYSSMGQVYVDFEILLHETEDHDLIIRRHLRALKELFQRMADWLDGNGRRYRSVYSEIFARI
jgi:hypothetical protein